MEEEVRRIRVGQGFGAYRILAPIGAGGMGEVYRAHDTRLGRDVAIKILPHRFASDPERLARFAREARLLAALNHPHIGGIYGLDEAGGVQAIILELVDGETLADRLHRGPLATADALAIARQIADALDAAHEKGIVHRDLKPANIKITNEGVVKVLDFGLAKAVTSDRADNEFSQLETNAERTREGVVLGTPAYMSPEQARGKPTDRRTDIWALGIILYEMLCGRRPFDGETRSDITAAILTKEPEWDRLPAETSAPLRMLLRRLLQKDPKRRLRDVADAFLTEVQTEREELRRDEPARRWMVAAGIAVGVAIAATALAWRSTSKRTEPQWSGQVIGGPTNAMGPRLSPDGGMLAFQTLVDGLNQVAVMKPDSGHWRVLTEDRSRGPLMDLSWSPDGTKIYFDRYLDAPGGVFSVPIVGGDVRPVVNDAMYPKAVPDGTLLIVKLNAERRLQLYRYSPDDARTEALPAFWVPNSGWPLVAVFPNGREAVFYGLTKTDEPAAPYTLNVIDLESADTRVLDATVRILQGAFPGGLAVSRDGERVIVDMAVENLHRIISIDSHGSSETRSLLTLSETTGYLDTGPDGVVYADQIGRACEILRLSESGASLERIATVASSSVGEVWPLALPDGRVLFSSRLLGKFRLMVAGAGRDPAVLLETGSESRPPAAVLGGDEIAFVVDSGPNQSIGVASLATGQILRRLEGTRGVNVQSLAVSADKRTIVYASRGKIWSVDASRGVPREIYQGDAVALDTTTNELIVQRFDATGVRLVRVSAAGGEERPVKFDGDARLALFPLAGAAVDRRGRIAVQVTAPDSWFFRPGVIDPVTGRLERVLLNYNGDVLSPVWGSGNEIISVGFPLTSSLWLLHADSR